MIHSQTRQNKQIDELERIRMLEIRMRNRGKPLINQQSLRSIKSTDSKKQPQYKNKVILLEQRSNHSFEDANFPPPLNLQQIKSNRKLTDYYPTLLSTARTSETSNHQKSPPPTQKPKNMLDLTNDLSNNSTILKSLPLLQDPLKQQNKTLKQKLRIKQQNIIKYKQKIKKDLINSIITIHNLKKNELKTKIINNKIRLGQYYLQKNNNNNFWIDGFQIKQIKSEIQIINKQKQQLDKSKKYINKKFNKQFCQDQDQWKNVVNSQMHFYTREQAYLTQSLKKLQQQKLLHIKQSKLLHDEQNSKYGKIDHTLGTQHWPKISQYQLLSLLGKGGFSQVYKAFDTQQLKIVAVKLHQLSPQWNNKVKQSFIKHAIRQQSVHRLLNHPNIVKLLGTIQIDNNAFCTILQYCDGPDLSYYLKKHKRLSQKQAKLLIKQVINAIKYLHELPQKVIHYDLKPQNILFHKGKIKITDFGLCKTTNKQIIQLTSQGVGTYWYLPPQCFVTESQPLITPKVDVWSIGVIYFQMLYGQKPFGNQMTQLRILNQSIILKANTVNFPTPPKCIISTESKQFIKSCLKSNPDDRLDIQAAALHPLFQKR